MNVQSNAKAGSVLFESLPPHKALRMNPRSLLDTHTVHVWRINLALANEQIARLQATLSLDEIQRAESYRFERDRSRFITSRGCLRMLLAHYTHATPSAIVFQYAASGKPHLAPSTDPLAPDFNLSHSGDMALVAICLHHRIGIDIECIRSDIEHEQLVRRFFAPTEISDYLSLPPSERLTAFYRCWTRKEAYAKARGEGIALPFNQFTVTLLTDESARLQRRDLEPAESSHWTLMDLPTEPAAAAALSVEGTGWKICYFDMHTDLK